MARPVLTGSHPINLFEVARKMAFVTDSNPVHDLFHIEERGFEKSPGFLHSERPQILRERHSGLCLEQIAQVRQREVDGDGHLAGS